MSEKYQNSDEFFSGVQPYNNELNALRSILLKSDLVEDFKWNFPCYTYNKKNVVMLPSYKNECVLLFFKGALLTDSEHVLKKPGQNTQSSRYFSVINVDDIHAKQPIISAYIAEAIELEKAGKKIDPLPVSAVEMPIELHHMFSEDRLFETAFTALTKGRQKAYLVYFSGSKNATTRLARIERYKSRILAGKGMHDCTCGHSKKMPGCDGSHKYYTQS